LLNRILPKRTPQRNRSALSAAPETEATFSLGTRLLAERDRYPATREQVLAQAFEAWRVNPLARRIVALTTQYVVGAGVTLRADHAATQAFLGEWWNHRLNQLAMRVYEWCDELTRAGELFLLVSTDAAGMSYVRAVPAGEISAVETARNDAEQELCYVQRSSGGGDETTWPAYHPLDDQPDDQGRFKTVMLHYAINRPAGAVRGESDLAPLLRWLSRYSAWLEDRARLNRFRQTFLFVVRARFASESERQARQAALNSTPPPPGSILVTDPSEEWSVLNPELDSADAAADGLALKKMIASGSGLPLHFLAEPESATRTTAESAGGPTFRRFEQRQVFFLWLVRDLARMVVRRRAMAQHGVDAQADIQVRGADISGRDNASLSISAATIAGAMKDLRDRGLIDDAELLRIVYKFAGEVVDVEDLLHAGQRAPARSVSETAAPASGRPAGVKVDPISGEVKGL
jgi:hypothetical protein